MKTRTLFTVASVLLISTTLVLAQSGTGSNTTGSTNSGGSASTPAAQSAPTATLSFPNTFRETEDAARSLERALRSAYQFEYLSTNASTNTSASVNLPDGLEATAKQLLTQAQESYTNQAYFKARQQADAAEKLYKALEKVLGANGVSLPAGTGVGAPPPPAGSGPLGKGPKGPGPLGEPAGPASGDALYKAQEEIYVLNQEMSYYDASTDTVTKLVQAAQNLLKQAQTTATQNSSSIANTALYGTNPVASAYADAAGEVAKAARNLIAAERGF